MKKLNYILYWMISMTWGFIMTFIGAVAALFLLLTKHKPKHLGPNVYFVVGENWGGVNLGPFFIVSSVGEELTIFHEAGHGLQNILFGPLFPFLVAIPSVIRYWYRELKYFRKGDIPSTDYDAIWFEGQATKWGSRVYL